MAFPVVRSGNQSVQEEGLSKREYFAAMAMQGMLAVDDKGDKIYHSMDECMDDVAKFSVLAADALIRALNETK